VYNILLSSTSRQKLPRLILSLAIFTIIVYSFLIAVMRFIKVNPFVQSMKRLSPAKLASIAGIAIFMVGFLVYFIARYSSTDMAILYNDLEAADSREIIKQLDGKQIPYKLTNNGATIMVASKDVDKTRVQMAENALPSSGAGVGYEIFDKSDALGATNFSQNINLVRALEGELSKTIKTIENVKNARVHLVLPKREMFTREEQIPTASVIIKTKGGLELSKKEVLSIQYIVAAAVPKMNVKNVSVIDTTGKLLTPDYENENELEIANQEEARIKYEKKLENNIESLLEKTVGPGKVRAEVSVEMDFDKVVTNSESYDPDQQVVRSTSTVEETSLSNEKDGSSVTVSQNLPNESQTPDGAGTNSQSSRTEETVNYEISKTVTNKVRSSGIVKRLSVAVMVDGIYDNTEDGTTNYRNRNEQEMELLAALVRSAIGYDANRGDQVEVVNMKFMNFDDAFEEEKPILLGFTKSEVMRMAEGMGVALVAILVILLVIRPLISKAFEGTGRADEASPKQLYYNQDGTPRLTGPYTGGDELEEMELDELIDIAKVEGRVKASSLRKIGEIVNNHPEEALNIIRNWLYQD